MVFIILKRLYYGNQVKILNYSSPFRWKVKKIKDNYWNKLDYLNISLKIISPTTRKITVQKEMFYTLAINYAFIYLLYMYIYIYSEMARFNIVIVGV